MLPNIDFINKNSNHNFINKNIQYTAQITLHIIFVFCFQKLLFFNSLEVSFSSQKELMTKVSMTELLLIKVGMS